MMISALFFWQVWSTSWLKAATISAKGNNLHLESPGLFSRCTRTSAHKLPKVIIQMFPWQQKTIRRYFPDSSHLNFTLFYAMIRC